MTILTRLYNLLRLKIVSWLKMKLTLSKKNVKHRSNNLNSNEHIHEFLEYYCDLPQSPEYAVMIKGEWGSGKTWFIRDYLKSKYPSNGERFEKKPYMYISLYGIRSFSEIGDEMFSQAHPLLSSKGARIAGKVLKSIAKSALKFEIKDEKATSGSAEVNVDLNELIGNLSTNTNMILVFDDIERCSIPINELLGYINQFVEHDGIKAILVANENEIFVQDSRNDSAGQTENEENKIVYRRIKEKLIGRTLEVKSQYENAFTYFVSQLPTPDVMTVVSMNKDIVQQIYKDSKFENLRLLRNALWDFDRLYLKLEIDIKRKDKLITELLAIFLAYSFEIGKGVLEPENIEQFSKAWLADIGNAVRNNATSVEEDDPLEKYSLIRKKYIGIDLRESLLTPELWVTIFTTGGIPEQQLNESLKYSKYFLDENQPNWIKLWHGIDLSDDDFMPVLNAVKKEWGEHKFTLLEEVLQVVGLFIYFTNKGINNQSLENILDESKKYIDWMFDNKLINIDLNSPNKILYDDDQYEGKGYSANDTQEFKEVLTYLNTKEIGYRTIVYKTESEELLVDLINNPDLFYEKLGLSNSKNNLFYKTPILTEIEPAKLVETLLNVKNSDLRTISYAFSRRYEINQFHESLMSELEWLKNVVTELNIAIQSRKGKISSITLNFVLEKIKKSIASLEKSKLTLTRQALLLNGTDQS